MSWVRGWVGWWVVQRSGTLACRCHHQGSMAVFLAVTCCGIWLGCRTPPTHTLAGPPLYACPGQQYWLVKNIWSPYWCVRCLVAAAANRPSIGCPLLVEALQPAALLATLCPAPVPASLNTTERCRPPTPPSVLLQGRGRLPACHTQGQRLRRGLRASLCRPAAHPQRLKKPKSGWDRLQHMRTPRLRRFCGRHIRSRRRAPRRTASC